MTMLLGDTEKKAREPFNQEIDGTIPAAITDTGCERELNEDRYAVIDSQSGLAWIVCDGMGGATGGELAAQLAIDAIRRDLENLPPRPTEMALRSSILEANRVIVLRRQNQAFAQMGTTIVACMFNGPEMVIGHVGDSRAYLIRDGAIQQLTTDHTYVQELVNHGDIRADEALSHPQAHILTRAIGSEPALEVDCKRFWIWEADSLDPCDTLLLCSDGLYSLIAEGEVANIISTETPQTACVRLVELAKERGGYDNITLAVIPLAGQLRQEPPPGYSESDALQKRMETRIQRKQQPKSFGKLAVIVGLLSLLSAVLVVLVVAIAASQ